MGRARDAHTTRTAWPRRAVASGPNIPPRILVLAALLAAFHGGALWGGFCRNETVHRDSPPRRRPPPLHLGRASPYPPPSEGLVG